MIEYICSPHQEIKEEQDFYKICAVCAVMSFDLSNKNRTNQSDVKRTQEVAQEAAISWQQISGVKNIMWLHSSLYNLTSPQTLTLVY